MIEIKKLSNPQEQILQYWMNFGFEFLYSAQSSNYHDCYLKRGIVGDDKTAMQWADDWREKFNACEKSEKEALEKLEKALAELNTIAPQAAIEKERADTLDAQLIALGEENRRLRKLLEDAQKKRKWRHF